MKKDTAIIMGSIMVLVLVVTLVVLAVLLSQKTKEDKDIVLLPPTQPTTISQDSRIDREKTQSKEIDSNLPKVLEEKKEGEELTIALFDGETLECDISETFQEGPDVKSVTCSSERYLAYLSFDGEIVLGTIDDYHNPNESYVVVSNVEDGKIYLEEHKKAL